MMRDIPYGETATYGGMAMALGSGPRADRHGLRRAIPSPSSCPATACWAAAARKAASRAAAACRPSGSCWRSRASFFSNRRRATPPSASDETAPSVDDGSDIRSEAGYGERMRVLITRPEREAAALATALGERGHAPVIAPLFRLEYPASAGRLRRRPRRLPGRAADQRQRRARARRSERPARQADPGGRRHHGQHRRRAGLQRRRLGRRRLAQPWPTSCASASIPKAGPLLHVVGRRRGARSRRGARR